MELSGESRVTTKPVRQQGCACILLQGQDLELPKSTTGCLGRPWAPRLQEGPRTDGMNTAWSGEGRPARAESLKAKASGRED